MDHSAAISRCYTRWFEAVVAGDTTPFADRLADDFCYVDIFGAVRDRAGYHALLADIPAPSAAASPTARTSPATPASPRCGAPTLAPGAATPTTPPPSPDRPRPRFRPCSATGCGSRPPSGLVARSYAGSSGAMKVPGWVAPPWQWSTGWPGQGAVSWVVSSGGVTTSMSGVQARPGSQAPGPAR